VREAKNEDIWTISLELLFIVASLYDKPVTILSLSIDGLLRGSGEWGEGERRKGKGERDVLDEFLEVVHKENENSS
jgi:hypothetical protein